LLKFADTGRFLLTGTFGHVGGVNVTYDGAHLIARPCACPNRACSVRA
jgi:hypothetical protein